MDSSSKTKRPVLVPKALAGPSVSADPTQRLQKVVEFARADFQKATAKELILADRDVYAICGVRFGFFAPQNQRACRQVRKSLIALQGVVRQMLTAMVAGRDALSDAFSGAAASPYNFHHSEDSDISVTLGSVAVTFIGPNARHLETPIRVTVHIGPGYCRLGGSARDMFLLELQRLLDSAVSQHVRACPNCRTIFFRVRRQVNCSAKCRDRNYWKTSPVAEAARQRYYDSRGWTRGARKKT